MKKFFMKQLPHKTDSLRNRTHRWVKNHPVMVLAHLGYELFILMQFVAVFISLHPQYCLDPSELETLLSEGVQTLSGLYGITMTGYVFFLGRIDALVNGDWTIQDVVDSLKKRFVRMIYVISATFMVSLFLDGLSFYLQSYGVHIPLYLHLLLLNESLLFVGISVVVIIYYIINMVDPDNLRRTADSLRQSIESEEAESGDVTAFFTQFHKLEERCKAMLPKEVQNTPLGTLQLDYLRKNGMISSEMLETVKKYRQYYSCILHGSEINVSQTACDEVAKLVKQLSVV